MQRSRLNKSILFCLLLLLKCWDSRAQEALTTVALEKLSATSFRIKYKLNNNSGYKYGSATLKLYRRRDGAIEEVFSGPVTPAAGLRSNQTYSYNWKTDANTLRPGDELQAKVVVSFTRPAPVAKAGAAPLPNLPPKADAGPDLELQLPVQQSVTLDGMRSYDEDGRIIAINWRQTGGPSNILISSQHSYKTPIAGDFKEGSYSFELTVTDDRGVATTDNMMITVKPAAVQPLPQVQAINPRRDSVLTSKPPVTKYAMPRLRGGPSNALINVLLPGVGHYFVSGDHYGNDRKPAVFIITALYAGSVGGAVYYKLRSNSEHNKYMDLANYREYQRDDNGAIIGVRGTNQAKATQYLSDSRNSHNNFLILTSVSAGIMVADLVYTFIKGSRNKKQWESEANAKLRPSLFISSNGTNLTAGVRLKF